jgi:hypothetical protein
MQFSDGHFVYGSRKVMTHLLRLRKRRRQTTETRRAMPNLNWNDLSHAKTILHPASQEELQLLLRIRVLSVSRFSPIEMFWRVSHNIRFRYACEAGFGAWKMWGMFGGIKYFCGEILLFFQMVGRSMWTPPRSPFLHPPPSVYIRKTSSESQSSGDHTGAVSIPVL